MIIFLCLLLVAGVATVFAETATNTEMDRVCRNWLSYMTFQKGAWGGTSDPAIVDNVDVVAGGRVIGHCYSISPDGFVLVPILKELPPVKAYSETGCPDFEKSTGLPGLLKDVLLNRIELFEKVYGNIGVIQPVRGDILFGQEHRAAWDTYTMTSDQFEQEFLSKGTMESMDELGPLLTTLWHQRPPYSDSCPNCGTYPIAGCVPLAAAQIVNYHQWPPFGVGSHTYWWDATYCNGNNSQYLTADFSDSYTYDETDSSVAELCFEMGVAYEAEYMSGATSASSFMTPSLFPEFFRYRDQIIDEYRIGYSVEEWYQIIRDEIDAFRPIIYCIPAHNIVCDGYRDVGDEYQYHMNYGWTEGQATLWYTLDNLYCYWMPDSLCPFEQEYIFRNIEPAYNVGTYADPQIGQIPYEVVFSGISELAVDSWTWDFGDGDFSFEQNPTHIYDSAGFFNVSLQITSDGETYTETRDSYISALADSIMVVDVYGGPGEIVQVGVFGKNMISIEEIEIPVEYIGDLDIEFDSFSTIGCRTEEFKVQELLYNQDNKLFFHLDARSFFDTLPDLEPGSGELVKLYFTIPAGASFGDITTISMEGFDNYQPAFYHRPYVTGSQGTGPSSHRPFLRSGTVSLPFLCGDVDKSGGVNILDITYLINYLYKDGPPPDPPVSGDADGSGGLNILDITYLINYLYKEGGPPIC